MMFPNDISEILDTPNSRIGASRKKISYNLCLRKSEYTRTVGTSRPRRQRPPGRDVTCPPFPSSSRSFLSWPPSSLSLFFVLVPSLRSPSILVDCVASPVFRSFRFPRVPKLAHSVRDMGKQTIATPGDSPGARVQKTNHRPLPISQTRRPPYYSPNLLQPLTTGQRLAALQSRSCKPQQAVAWTQSRSSPRSRPSPKTRAPKRPRARTPGT